MKKIYKNIKSNFYDKQMKSRNPLRKWFHVNRYRIINNLVTSKFVDGMEILDLGCGSCNWNTGNLKVYGIDLNENLLKLAKNEGRLIDYKITDTDKTGFDNESSDIVIASEVLEHIHNYDDTIREIHRILRPGGYVIISVPFDTFSGFWKYLFFLQCLFQGYILMNAYYRKNCGHVNHFSHKTIKEAFLRNNFLIDSVFTMRRFTIFLVARKKGIENKSLSYEDTTVILPTLNEGPNIKDLLSQLSTNFNNINIIVSDDGSSDDTKDIVSGFRSGRINFLDRKNFSVHGLTASVLDAIGAVKTKYFIVMDADGQHPWQKTGELINSLRLGSKLVISSRIKVEGSWPLLRKIMSYLGTALGKISLLMRQRFYLSYDILSGFFGAETDFWKTAVLNVNKKNKFQLKGYKILFDFLKIIPKDSQFSEVYYEFNSRKKAISKINYKVHIEYLKSVIS